MARVLVVDDEPHIRRLLQLHLVNAGYEVLIANTGEKALEIIKESAPQLIILDMLLPGINGDRVKENVRNNPETAKILIIILSICQDESTDKSDRNTYYMPKPFSPFELMALVKKALAAVKSYEQAA